MPYSTNGELPQQVRGALDDHEQDVWRRSFNQTLEELGDERSAFRVAWHAASKLEGVRAISGKASLDLIDSQGERINQEALVVEINDTIWNYGLTLNDTHTNHPFGVWFDAVLENEGGIAVSRVYGAAYKGSKFADACWKEHILTGDKNRLSVGIMKIDPKMKCSGAKCWRQIDKMQVFEISDVPKGSCPGTVLDQINFSAKSKDGPARAGDMKMDKSTDGAKPPDATPEASDKETPPTEEPKKEAAPKEASKETAAPDAGSMGALAEGMQKLIGMVSEQNSRMDRLEAGLASIHASGAPAPAPKAEEKTPPQAEPEAAAAGPDGKEQGAKPEAKAEGEKPAEAPTEEPKKEVPPAEKPEEKTSDKGAPGKADVKPDGKKYANKAEEIVAANKSAREEAETNGASAERPEMLGDGADKIAAKPKEKKPWAERFEELARIANKQGTKGLEMEGNKVVRREGI